MQSIQSRRDTLPPYPRILILKKQSNDLKTVLVFFLAYISAKSEWSVQERKYWYLSLAQDSEHAASGH